MPRSNPKKVAINKIIENITRFGQLNSLTPSHLFVVEFGKKYAFKSPDKEIPNILPNNSNTINTTGVPKIENKKHKQNNIYV